MRLRERLCDARRALQRRAYACGAVPHATLCVAVVARTRPSPFCPVLARLLAASFLGADDFFGMSQAGVKASAWLCSGPDSSDTGAAVLARL